MREVAFIKSNVDKWRLIDYQTKSNNIPSDTLAGNFIELTDDLSYARTFYPGSRTVMYLNRIAGRYFINISRYRKYNRGWFTRFWIKELPLIMYKYRKCMLYSAIFFIGSILLGVFSQSQDPEFVKLILGPRYVDMTIDNIEKGDPMAVYKDSDKGGMLLVISQNNIRVSLYCFVFGIFFSVGSIYFLFVNGMIIGVFQYFFFEKGLLLTSASTIWLHGILEISSFVISGGAGIALGNSLLFPGSFKRIVSLQKTTPEVLKIVLGLVPVFMIAAFIESYITRLTDMPLFMRLIIIGGSAVFIGWYFFYYPSFVKRKVEKTNKKNNI